MIEIIDIELNRLRQNLENTNKDIEALINQRQQLIGAISISERYLQLIKAVEKKMVKHEEPIKVDEVIDKAE